MVALWNRFWGLSPPAALLAAGAAWFAEDQPASVLKRMDPVRRAEVLMALVGLVVLGLGLIALVVLAGWMVRRRARQRNGPSRLPSQRTGIGPLPPADHVDDLASPPGYPDGRP